MKVTLRNVRTSFLRVWEAKPYEEGSHPRYSANILIEPGSDNDKAIRAAITATARENWGEKSKAILGAIAGDSGKFCYQDGNRKGPNGDMKETDGYEGMWWIASNRNQKDGAPALVGRGGPDDHLKEEDGILYSGCYVNATLDIYAQKGKYQGMRSTLVGLQFVSDGDSFGGAPRASANDFEALDASTEEDDGGFGNLDSAATASPAPAGDDDGF